MNEKLTVVDLNRTEKEVRIKKFFNSYTNKPSFKNFSFSSKSKLNDQSLKFVGAFTFLKILSNNKKENRDIKDRTYFFVFLDGDIKTFNKKEFTSELYDLCSYFSKISVIRIVFDFGNEYKIYKYSDANGVISDADANKLESSGVDTAYDFIKNPDDFISTAIEFQKYLTDCYKAFTSDDQNGLNFIENEFYNTHDYYNRIVKAITDGKKLVIVNGPAGSGKTILALRLLGKFKNSNLLIFNEYFHAELEKEFKSHQVSDIDLDRFYNHRHNDSVKIVEDLIKCNNNHIPINVFLKNFNKFIYKKHWSDKNEKDRPDSNFWNKYLNPNSKQYELDYEAFVKENKQDHFEPTTYLILDEGQRVYQETIDVAVKNGLTLILLGDMKQKLNPDTDDLLLESDQDQILDKTKILEHSSIVAEDIEEIILTYPVRISSNALEKISNIIGLSDTKKYLGEQSHYPITIHATVDEFINQFKKDKENRKFYCSYSDIWRYEKNRESAIVEKQKVKQVKFLDKTVMVTFDNGWDAFVNKRNMYKISDELGIKIVDMAGIVLNVRKHETKSNRYIVENRQNFSLEKNRDEYYTLSEIILKDSTIRSIGKKERSEAKSALLIDPQFRNRIFTPYELISRECRNIYLYLPKSVTISNHMIIDNERYGKRFYNEETNTNYLLNQIYVLMTRAVRSIHIYCEDQKLSEYFKMNLQKYEKETSLFDIND